MSISPSRSTPSCCPQIADSLHELLDHEKPALNHEVSRIDAATSEARHWLFSFFPVLVGKAVIGIGLVAMDISERKRAEMHLREREQQFRGIVEQSIAGAYILQDGRLAYVNRRFAEIFGYTTEQMQTLDPLSLVTEAERPHALEIIRTRMSGETQTRNYEFTAIHADGNHFDLGVHASCASHRSRPAIIGLVQNISGKITLPVIIFSKSGRLSAAEFMLIKGHPQAGYDVLKNVEFPWPVATIILQHHERLDGSGYPGGIRDAEILPESRILAIADVVDAMSSHRP